MTGCASSSGRCPSDGYVLALPGGRIAGLGRAQQRCCPGCGGCASSPAAGDATVDLPDFTRGAWQTRPPPEIVEAR